MRTLLALVTLAAVVASGCISTSTLSKNALAPSVAQLAAPVFDAAKIIDTVRAGGEPGVVVTPKGTILVASHPGYTHFTDPDPDLVAENSAQTYMWRSTDHGKTWTYVGLPMANAGPRNAVWSISDPDFSVDAQGNVYYSDLWAVDLSSQKSTDDGQTWLQGVPIVAHQPTSDNPANGAQPDVDRNWIAAGKEANVVYLSWQGSKGVVVGKSTDGGITYPQQVPLDIPYNILGKIRVDPTTGYVLQPLATDTGVVLARSTDGGRTWKALTVHNATGKGNFGADGNLFPNVDVDKAGNYYAVWSEGEQGQRVQMAWSADHGDTWSKAIDVSPANATAMFPWIVAGADGRVAVLWIQTDEVVKPAEAKGKWFVHVATTFDARSEAPTFAQALVSSKPNHEGNICTSGVGCVTVRGDRRLGDYFTAAIDPKGDLVVAYADTSLGGGIAHPSVVVQTGGPTLRASG